MRPARVRFKYPQSWTLAEAKAAPAGVAAFDLRQGSAATGLVGLIRVKVLSREHFAGATADDLVKSWGAEMTEAGVELGKPAYDADLEPEAGFAGGCYLLIPARVGGQADEARLLVLSTRDAWVVVSMLGPVRERGAMEWMVVKRAFEVVHDTLRVE